MVDTKIEFDIYEGIIQKRPSIVIKSPFVSDVIINENNSLAHTPSLGCNGMVEKGEKVIMTKQNNNTKCEFTIIAVNYKEKMIIGVDPRKAEDFAYNALMNNLVSGLSDIVKIDKQVTIYDCRFDFVGYTKIGEPFIIEVKNVSIADYENIPMKLLKKRNQTNYYDEYNFNSKIAYFPSNIANKNNTNSTRSIKQLNTLIKIKKETPKIHCIVLYVIQRTDIKQFQPNFWDLIYTNKIQEAYKNNIEFKSILVDWKFSNDSNKLIGDVIQNNLPIFIYDNYNNIN